MGESSSSSPSSSSSSSSSSSPSEDDDDAAVDLDSLGFGEAAYLQRLNDRRKVGVSNSTKSRRHAPRPPVGRPTVESIERPGPRPAFPGVRVHPRHRHVRRRSSSALVQLDENELTPKDYATNAPAQDKEADPKGLLLLPVEIKGEGISLNQSAQSAQLFESHEWDHPSPVNSALESPQLPREGPAALAATEIAAKIDGKGWIFGLTNSTTSNRSSPLAALTTTRQPDPHYFDESSTDDFSRADAASCGRGETAASSLRPKTGMDSDGDDESNSDFSLDELIHNFKENKGRRVLTSSEKINCEDAPSRRSNDALRGNRRESPVSKPSPAVNSLTFSSSGDFDLSEMEESVDDIIRTNFEPRAADNGPPPNNLGGDSIRILDGHSQDTPTTPLASVEVPALSEARLQHSSSIGPPPASRITMPRIQEQALPSEGTGEKSLDVAIKSTETPRWLLQSKSRQTKNPQIAENKISKSDRMPRTNPKATTSLAPAADSKNTSSNRRKCKSVYLGSSDAKLGYNGGGFGFGKKTCNKLRCTGCDFEVLRIPNKAWSRDVNYEFLRNHMPFIDKLKPMLVHHSGACAYACQCSWKSVEKGKWEKISMNTSTLRWCCAGHL
jgi:hypothetical protein